MHIISSKEKTDHVLLRIIPFSQYGFSILSYTSPPPPDEFLDYGYAYFELTKSIKNWFGEYAYNWKKGKLRITKYPIDLFEIKLLELATIENEENSRKPEYKYIKYDSLNFLKESPALDLTDKYYVLPGRFLCSFKQVELEIERIPDGSGFPWIIYRSLPYLYYDFLDKNLIK